VTAQHGAGWLLVALVTITVWVWQVWMWAFPESPKAKPRGFEVILPEQHQIGDR
jgi:hypothetical protein